MIVYDKLWNMLKEKGMTRTELRLKINAATNTFASMTACRPVSGTTIERICKVLGCQPGDIMEYVPDEDYIGEDDDPPASDND